MKTLSLLLVAWLAVVGGTVGAAETFAIFAPDEKPADVAALAAILAPSQPHGVPVAKTPEEALKSPAEVLVLFLHRQKTVLFPEAMLPELRKKKVIGIGYGAAEVFGALKLEINGGACAHGHAMPAPVLDLPKDALLPPAPAGPLTAYELPDGPGQAGGDYNFGMYLPATDKRTKFVTALARWQGDGNYAPIVRQGNYVMVGVAAPATAWTADYRTLFGALAARFAKTPRVEFAMAAWKETPPGNYEVELAEGRSTKAASNEVYHFRFGKPGRFSAVLEHAGSESVMLLFMGPQRAHWTREDAKKGEPLRIAVEITEEDITKAGVEYWELKVTNFDARNRAKCKVMIDYPAGP